jgi:hypothetical protein
LKINPKKKKSKTYPNGPSPKARPIFPSPATGPAKARVRPIWARRSWPWPPRPGCLRRRQALPWRARHGQASASPFKAARPASRTPPPLLYRARHRPSGTRAPARPACVERRHRVAAPIRRLGVLPEQAAVITSIHAPSRVDSTASRRRRNSRAPPPLEPAPPATLFAAGRIPAPPCTPRTPGRRRPHRRAAGAPPPEARSSQHRHRPEIAWGQSLFPCVSEPKEEERFGNFAFRPL